MEIISAMKVLIIFFIVLIIIFLSIIFLKIKLHVNIVIDNLKIYVKVKVFKKEFKIKFILKKKENRKSKNKSKSNKNRKKIKLKNNVENKLSLIKDIAEVIEIDSLKLNVLIGTPFVFLTIFASQVVNILIPYCFRLPFKQKKNISYKTLASYNDFELKVKLNTIISITPYKALLIFLRYYTVDI